MYLGTLFMSWLQVSADLVASDNLCLILCKELSMFFRTK